MTSTLARMPRLRARQLLARVLEDPGLVAAVHALEPRVLGRLIRHVGLEDSGELVSLATTEQLEGILDEDLWRSERPGKDEVFDAARFALWLEVMLEAGEDFTAQRLAELPEDLITLALLRHVLVLDVDALAVQMEGGDDALTEKALDGCLSQELDQYQIVARRHDGWDAIVSVLVALDRDHHDLLQRILERCCHLSTEYVEENGGLYEVLTSEEMLEADVAAEREEHRARAGFIAPSSAASFLGLARVTALQDIVESRAADPITRAYFRALDASPETAAKAPAASPRAPETAEKATRLAALLEHLDDADAPREKRPKLLAGSATSRSPRSSSLFERAVVELHARDPMLHSRRMDELGYLANVLVAGCSFARRRFRPFEAIEAVVATCNLGLERLREAAPGEAGGASPSGRAADVLALEPADKLFRVGWHLLHAEVALPAADALARAVARATREATDRDAAARLAQVASAVRSAVAAGRPWVLLPTLDTLGSVLDERTRTSLEALLDECPSLSGEPEDGVVSRARRSRHGRTFIATEQQLLRARRFLARL